MAVSEEGLLLITTAYDTGRHEQDIALLECRPGSSFAVVTMDILGWTGLKDATSAQSRSERWDWGRGQGGCMCPCLPCWGGFLVRVIENENHPTE